MSHLDNKIVKNDTFMRTHSLWDQEMKRLLTYYVLPWKYNY